MLIQLALHETLNRCYVITDKPKQVIEEESMQTPKQRIPTTTCRVCILRRDGFHKKRLTRRILYMSIKMVRVYVKNYLKKD